MLTLDDADEASSLPTSRSSGWQTLDGYTVSVYRCGMIQSFADAATADLWAERNSKAARRVPRAIWPTVHRKLTMLDAAQRLDDPSAVAGNRLEALVGTGRGAQYSREPAVSD
jgi:plasmid maintenance system killer protein